MLHGYGDSTLSPMLRILQLFVEKNCPLSIISQRTFLAKSTSSCSRSIVDTVFTACRWCSLLRNLESHLPMGMRAIARSLSPTSGLIFSFGLARKDAPAQHSEPSNYDTGLHEDSKQHIHHGQRPEQNEYHNQSRHDPALLFWVATFHCPRREGKKQTKRCSTKLSSATASIMNCWSVRMHLLRGSLTGAVALFVLVTFASKAQQQGPNGCAH